MRNPSRSTQSYKHILTKLCRRRISLSKLDSDNVGQVQQRRLGANNASCHRDDRSVICAPANDIDEDELIHLVMPEEEPLPPVQETDEDVFKKLEIALQETNNARTKRWSDYIHGITDALPQLGLASKCLIIYENKKITNRRKHKLMAPEETRLTEKPRRLQPIALKNLRKSTLQPARETAGELCSRTIGLQWTLSPNALPIRKPNIGQLCRNSYPVTEGLHREKTSTTMLKGKTLRVGDYRVSKVLPRIK